MRWRKKGKQPELEETDSKYSHTEAFCLMTYQYESCKRIEIIWNSRDGVTPFIILCKFCGGEATHIKWEEDACIPDHIPQVGDRIFIDTPKKIAALFARMRLQAFENLEHPPPKAGTPEREKLEESIIEDLYQDGKSPWLVQI